MAPTTEFEDTNGLLWTSLNSEQGFLETIADETSATLTQAGTSVEGRPLWRIDVGDPQGPTMMLTGLVHGNEPAGREGVLQFVRDIAYSTDPSIISYLETHRVVAMPTINPDMNETGRFNANGVDININTLALIDQPEAFAFHSVRNDSGAQLVVDCHERLPGVGAPTDQMQYLRPQLDVLYDGIKTRGDELITHLQGDLDTAGITYGPYLVPGREATREAVSLNHALGFLLETNRDNSKLDRVGYWAVALESVRAWHGSNSAALTQMMAESSNYQATTTDQYILETGHLWPWGSVPIPQNVLGYVMRGLIPDRQFNIYGVQTQGLTVPLSQPARAVIPILLDEESDDRVIEADRTDTLPGPPIEVLEPETAAATVSGSFSIRAKALVIRQFQTGNNPAGTEIPIISGSVRWDAGADVYASIELLTPGMSELDRRDLFPRNDRALLSPYGNEIFLLVGIDYGYNVVWSPIGYFRIDSVESTGGPGDPLRISGQDRMAQIVDARRVNPWQYAADTSVETYAWYMARAAYPDVVIQFDDSSGASSLERDIIVEESRHSALADLADSLGKVVYFDGEGILRIEDEPDPENVFWEIKAGRKGVLTQASRKVSREGMFNAVVALGEGTGANPVRGVAYDVGKTSPTRWGSRFGKKPEFYNSPLLKTDNQARLAARSRLRRKIGLPYSVDFGAVPNPALRARMPVRITQSNGNREIHIVEQLTLNILTGEMSGSTREKTRIAISDSAPGGFDEL